MSVVRGPRSSHGLYTVGGSLSSLPCLFGVITGLELHWMGDGPAGTKEAENNAIWWFSRRTVLMTVPDSGATRVTVPSECSSGRDFLGNYNYYGICPNYPYFLSQPPVALIYHIFCFSLSFYAILDRRKPLETFVLLDCKGRRLHLSHHREDYPEPSFYLFYLHEVLFRIDLSKVDIRVFGEPIGLDLYCLLSHLDPNESLGIKIDQHRGSYHDSGLCMTSRHTRRNAQRELVTFTNQELVRLERTNRQQPRQTDTTVGDHVNQDDLAAAMALMQQQMQQMQQTIQAQQDAAEQTALARQEQQAQTKEESDCSKKGNSSDTQKIDELTAKVDQLLKNNQGHVFNMEQATAGHIQNQNKRQPQSNQQAVPANGNSQPDELKGLGMMMQQLLQGQQVQAKALNQVTTEIDTRMGNMFTELNNKYDNLVIHIRKIDVQLAQTVESVKRQQETLPGRTDKNLRTEHCNAVEQPFAETVLVAEENTEQSTSSEVIAPSEPAETPPVRVYVPKVPYPIPPRHLMDPISEEQLICFNNPRNYNYYGICPNYPYFLSQPPVALIYHIFCFSLSFYAILDRRKPLETFVLLDCKGRRLHLSHHREDYPEPSFYLFYLHEVLFRIDLSKVDIRVFGEPIGLDLYCLLPHLDPNESLGIKIDQHRGQFHDSGLFYLSDPSSRLALN
ncbi:hypothetical protein IGI04_019541 [Brassica rapa subsp. trilocularis]|uniref:Uncharacterized protein n=1 Tax=Brassica rapa subsp. trilocularis TaxID=1813537 RepID=A0ABQ7MG53_BRACM|nr:hypothetical protein IGI04_019541 [Brassica rapa subsp. trilocularis]